MDKNTKLGNMKMRILTMYAILESEVLEDKQRTVIGKNIEL